MPKTLKILKRAFTIDPESIDLSTNLDQGVTVLKKNWKFDQKQSNDVVPLVQAI